MTYTRNNFMSTDGSNKSAYKKTRTTAKELSPFSFNITPIELTIKALPANKNAIPAKSAVIDLIIFFGLILFYI